MEVAANIGDSGKSFGLLLAEFTPFLQFAGNCPSEIPSDVGDFRRMGRTGSNSVHWLQRENLRLVLQSAERR